MKFGFNFGFLGKGGASGPTPNVCVTQGTDGTWYGATLTSPPFGIIDPNETALGQKVFAFKWKADGDFIMRFGDLGDEQVPDVNIILVTTLNYAAFALTWNSTTSLYEGTNLLLATDLINAYVEGQDRCAYVQIIPNLFISYNFDLLRGTA